MPGLRGGDKVVSVTSSTWTGTRMVKIFSRPQGDGRDSCLKALRVLVFYDEPSTCAKPSIGPAFWPL
jgi:hypothetical protein